MKNVLLVLQARLQHLAMILKTLGFLFLWPGYIPRGFDLCIGVAIAEDVGGHRVLLLRPNGLVTDVCSDVYICDPGRGCLTQVGFESVADEVMSKNGVGGLRICLGCRVAGQRRREWLSIKNGTAPTLFTFCENLSLSCHSMSIFEELFVRLKLETLQYSFQSIPSAQPIHHHQYSII